MSARNFRMKIKEIEGILDPDKMAREAYDVFVENTPIKTGNARNNTILKKNEIHAEYPYATRLDQGWSKQSPDGMVEPTMQFLEEYIKKNLGR